VTGRAGSELEALIGEVALVRLAEAFGGTRLYIPEKMSAAHEIAKAIGLEAAQAMVRQLGAGQLKVPLAREQRARQYRAAGWSNARIARALMITESGVEKLFRRVAERDDRQGRLFG